MKNNDLNIVGHSVYKSYVNLDKFVYLPISQYNLVEFSVPDILIYSKVLKTYILMSV